jgi:hypothetical protein
MATAEIVEVLVVPVLRVAHRREVCD